MKRTLVTLVVAAVLLTALPLAAATGTWTAVASTGVLDESAAGIYAAGSDDLGYASSASGSSLAPIVARYNVTNTYGVADIPPWTKLELTYLVTNANSAVSATVFEVDPCTGSQAPLCTVTSTAMAAPNCKQCVLAHAMDFLNKLYYVQVTITRNDVTLLPLALTLRIF